MFKRFLVVAASGAWLTAICVAQTNTLPTTGNVGIGTTSPDKTLEVNGGIHLNMLGGINWSNNQSLLITNTVDTAAGDTGAQIWHGDSGAGGSHLLIFSSYPQTSAAFTGGYMVLNTKTGSVGIDTPTPTQALSVNGSISATNGQGSGQGVYFRVPTGGQDTAVSSTLLLEGMLSGNGTSATPYGLNIMSIPWNYGGDAITYHGGSHVFRVVPSAPAPANSLEEQMAVIDGAGLHLTASGEFLQFPDNTTQTTAWTGVLCGGDYAESVDVTGDRTKNEPGDLLVIDPDTPDKFLKSMEPYSTAVAGVYSTKPGVVGRHQATPKSEDEVPMAVVGIVPVKVSAENGLIRPRDLLVSASTPGYAMKGTDRSRMLGAIVGKAMGSLDSGTGVINVLVTLQ